MSIPTIHHLGLSTTFTGLLHLVSSSEAEVWQFRGIEYGSIPSRFKQSTVNEKFPEVYDASAYGPKCPQGKVLLRLEDGLIGLPSGLASHAEDVFDEFHCLNLNITTPAKSEVGSNLPVLLYIHGGGGRSGANSDWWCDGGSIVKKSVDLGDPVVMVAINYRLAVLGYIGSSELRKENGTDNGGNYGLRDVHTAIEWVSRHIAPFGGSPHNITIYGESAGSLSVNAQIHSLLPAYFSRAIMQSQFLGVPLTAEPQQIEEKTAVYAKMKEYLEVETVTELEQVPWQDLLQAYQICDPKHMLGEQAMIDGEFMSNSWAERVSFASGKGELILGSTGHEGAVFTMLMTDLPVTDPKPSTQDLINVLQSVAPAEKVEDLLQAYQISAATPQKEVADSLLSIVEDITFYKAADDLAIKLRKRGVTVHEYRFQQEQAFGGPFKGTAAHAVDLTYLHGHPSIFASLPDAPGEMAIQDQLQRDWIEFAHGRAPWGRGKVRIFGPRGGIAEQEREEVLREAGKGPAWEVLGGLTPQEKYGLYLAVVGFLGQLLGSGISADK